MEDISKYVEDLLYRHQCVIIPDFGAFISNRKSAEIAENKTFSPPSKALTFNSRLTSNDGLLIKHISEVEKINYELAQIKVRKSVKEWNTQLSSGQPLKFANLGVLQKQGEGRIEFSPSNDINLLTDSFGMSSFVPQEADTSEDQKQKPEGEIIGAPISSNTKAKTEVKKEKKKSKGGFLKYAAIIVLGLSAIGYGVFTFLQGGDNSSNSIAENELNDEATNQQIENRISEATFLKEAPLELPALSLNVVKGEENKVVNTEVKEEENTDNKEEKGSEVVAGSDTKEKAEEQPKTEEKSKVEDTKSKDKKETKQSKSAVEDKKQKSATKNKKETSKKQSKKSKEDYTIHDKSLKYHVIAGAFVSETNANTKVKQLRKQGYKAYVVGQNNRGLYQVSYQSFKKQSEADKFSNKIRVEKKLDSWVLETE